MEKDLTNEDFARMQQQAIKRVKEMQQRSKSDEQGTSDSQKEQEKFRQKQEKPPVKPSTEERKGQTNGLLSSLLGLDRDTALILPLLLLLGREGADDILLLALLYIMS